MSARSFAILMGAVLAACALLTGCASAPLPTMSLPPLPPVHVVRAYEGVAQYIAAVEADPEASRGMLYLEHAVRPYAEACWGLSPAALPPTYPAAMIPFWDFERLEAAIDLLKSAKVEETIRRGMLLASLALPGAETTICVFPVQSDEFAFVGSRMHGVAGHTVAADKIWLHIEPVGDWMDWLPYTIAHEHHHLAAMNRYGFLADGDNVTLLEVIVSEGRADSFAEILYPDKTAPWTRNLSPDQEARLWPQVQADFPSTDYALRERYLFTGGDALPDWIGYTIGYNIVQSYLARHPGLTIEEWSSIDAEEVLRESGYNPDSD